MAMRKLVNSFVTSALDYSSTPIPLAMLPSAIFSTGISLAMNLYALKKAGIMDTSALTSKHPDHDKILKVMGETIKSKAAQEFSISFAAELQRICQTYMDEPSEFKAECGYDVGIDDAAEERVSEIISANLPKQDGFNAL
jgi:hypothetical protein